MTRISSLATLLCIAALSMPQCTDTTQTQSPAFHRIVPQTPAGMRELLQHNGEPMHLVGSHRGGQRIGFPENCIATFENTLQSTFAMLEIDPRYSKDGVLMLHHDETLDRTTSGTGKLVDYTLAELKQLRLRDTEGNLTDYVMPTLDEALEWARGKTILVLDQKGVPIEDRVAAIEKHQAESYAMLIVSSLEHVKKVYALNPNIMMEVMVTSRERFDAFEQTGVPWSNVIAFVGHTPPEDPELYAMIHAKGAATMAGTSRNLDREFTGGKSTMQALKPDYQAVLDIGIDIIETDIPIEVFSLLYGAQQPPVSRAEFFKVGSQ
jgi:glycerophosphoryl diester phosphodiesterase